MSKILHGSRERGIEGTLDMNYSNGHKPSRNQGNIHWWSCSQTETKLGQIPGSLLCMQLLESKLRVGLPRLRGRKISVSLGQSLVDVKATLETRWHLVAVQWSQRNCLWFWALRISVSVSQHHQSGKAHLLEVLPAPGSFRTPGLPLLLH